MRNEILTASAVVLLAACGTAQPPARGGDATPADTAPAATASSGALLAYVTNEDSQDLTVIDTRTDSAMPPFLSAPAHAACG